jgi:hypothetical protein
MLGYWIANWLLQISNCKLNKGFSLQNRKRLSFNLKFAMTNLQFAIDLFCNLFLPFQKHRALGRNGFFAADDADAFAGFGLQADAFDFEVENFGEPFADSLAVHEEFGALGENDAIEIGDLPTECEHVVEGRPKHVGRISPLVDRIGLGEHLADIAQGRGAEQGVGNGMQQHIGVAKAEQLAIVRDIYTAQP